MAKSASMFKEPLGRVVTANAIRCKRYRNKKKEKLSDCPYYALEYLKWSSKYMNTIHHIGMDPFMTFWTSPDQLKLYKIYKKKNRYTKLSGDASGGMVHKLGKNLSCSHTSHRILLKLLQLLFSPNNFFYNYSKEQSDYFEIL